MLSFETHKGRVRPEFWKNTYIKINSQKKRKIIYQKYFQNVSSALLQDDNSPHTPRGVEFKQNWTNLANNQNI